MKKQMIASRAMTYGTRRLQADDTFEAASRDARLLHALGRARYATRDAEPEAPARDQDGDLAAVRDEYEAAVGRKPYHGWDIPTLREKIAAAKD